MATFEDGIVGDFLARSRQDGRIAESVIEELSVLLSSGEVPKADQVLAMLSDVVDDVIS